MNAIEVCELEKNFKTIPALRGLSFQVPQGSLCGLIGMNGAGKTTTLKILMEMLRADSGEATVLGHRVGREGLAIRRKTGFLPEGKRLFPYMSVRDVIDFVRPFYPKWRKDREAHLLRTFELPLERKMPALSKGMLAKLQLLLALSRGAELVILDEPTDGLDAIAVEEVLQEMATQVADEGTTVLFCSHRLEEIEQMVDHLVIIHEGRCLLDEAIDGLRSSARRFTVVLPDERRERLNELERWGAVRQAGRSVSLTVWREPEFAEAKLRDIGAFSIECSPLPLRQLFVDMVRAEKGKRNALA
jgi:ABC-2 type transport system ATP-binding protein